MRRYWWFVWVKVAVLAVILLVGYFAVKSTVNALIEPYVLETPRETVSEPSDGEAEEEEANIVDRVMGWVENVLDVQLDYESMIFDYANDYAKEMIEQSDDERNLTNQ